MLLKTELSLHQAEEQGKALESRNSRLMGEVQQLRLASSRAIKQFEKRTSDGWYPRYLGHVPLI